MRISLSNLGASAAWTTDSPDAAYPASNLSDPSRPFVPAKTAAGGTRYFQCDFGSAKAPPWLIVQRANFTGLTVQGDNDAAFGSPDFTSGALTTGFMPLTHRYQRAVDLTPFTLGASTRYLRFTVTGIVSDVAFAAALTVFRLGGIWIADPATALISALTANHPTKFTEAWAHTACHPRTVKRPEHGGWARTRIAGESYVSLRYPRRVAFNRDGPFSGDDAAGVAYRDALAARGGAFALWEDPLNNGAGNNALAWVVRDTGLDAREFAPSGEGPEVLESDWVVDECV